MNEQQDGYSGLFYFMLVIGIIGVVGFVLVAAVRGVLRETTKGQGEDDGEANEVTAAGTQEDSTVWSTRRAARTLRNRQEAS